MRVSRAVALGTVGLCYAGALVGLGGACGGSSTSVPDAGASGDMCNRTVPCALPPSTPTSGMPTTQGHNYAVYDLYLGGTNANPNAWETYGYNLDNLVTTSKSTDVCTLAKGASVTAQVDGNEGIDNSFGENLWPILQTLVGMDSQDKINATIQAGHFTIMTYVTGFDDTAMSTASATGLSGVLLAGGNYADANGGTPPAWNTTTHWPIVPTLLTGCTPGGGCPAGTDPVASATIKFGNAYQADGTFVSGSPANVSLQLSIGGVPLTIDISSAVITFQPQGPGAVTNGIIAGTLVASDLVQRLQLAVGAIEPGLCSGTASVAVAQYVMQAADIVIDPTTGAVTNGPGVACNGISIGLGFDAKEIAAPTSADIEDGSPPSPNPCATPTADAGTTEAGGD